MKIYECEDQHQGAWEFLDSWYTDNETIYHESLWCPHCEHVVETTVRIVPDGQEAIRNPNLDHNPRTEDPDRKGRSIMSPLVFHPNGKMTKVKNLGWLLRHWKDVEYFDVHKRVGKNHNTGVWFNYLIEAFLKDGRIFQTTWADLGVFKTFIERPVFKGIKVHYHKLSDEEARVVEKRNLDDPSQR